MNAGDIGSKLRLLKRAAKDIGMGSNKFTPGLESRHRFTVHGIEAGIILLLTTKAWGSMALNRLLNFF